jgi:hypothetical protein
MSSEYRQIVTIRRDAESPAPSLTFVCDARIDKGWMILLSEGSPALEAKWKLTQMRDGSAQVSEYVCAMPTSYQNFPVLDVPDVEVQAGDTFEFSVNDADCVCAFALEAYATAAIVPEPEPEVSEEPEAA